MGDGALPQSTDQGNPIVVPVEAYETSVDIRRFA